MIRDEIQKFIIKALKKEGIKTAGLSPALIERPKMDGFGDFSSPVALVLAKSLGQNPKNLAARLAQTISSENDFNKYFSKIEIAEPGFMNFHLTDEFLQSQIKEILKAGEEYGKNNWGEGQKIQVEFISANPTGPLTLGNGRGGVFGDVLGNIFKKSGFSVTKEYYINDAGGQIEILGHSVLKDGQAQYKGKYIDKLAEKIKGDNPLDVGRQAQKIILQQIKETTAKMGIKFDEWFSEQKRLRDEGKVEEVLKIMEKAGVTKREDGALWFKASEFSDEKDRVLVKSDGQPTYFGVDCAYHYNKLVERKFDKVINVWGADHHGDVARVRSFAEFLGLGDKLEFILTQFVRLVQNGQELRMSKRKGVYITVDEILAEVGQDAFRFFMLMYSPTTHMDFDLELAKQQSQKNPVYYIQYGYARINSILAKVGVKNKEPEATAKSLKLLKQKEELDLIRQLIKYPEIIADTARDYQVHRVSQYAKELMAAFHKFYECCRVLDEDKKIQNARLQLVGATKIVLKDILKLMGISAPDKM